VKLQKALVSAFRGNGRALEAHAKALKLQPSIRTGIQALEAQCRMLPREEHGIPIFLLSAGWRSGSTFLQRLIMSDPRVMIWGEPYDECGLIQSLAETVKAFREGWPLKEYFLDDKPVESLPKAWVANLFPSLAEWRAGHRALFETMFVRPAGRAGAERWGIKEVRLTADHAYYLRWLYPNARFIFLYRNPLDAYSSYCRHGRSWYDTFPDKPVFTAAAFGAHWRTVTESFVKEANSLDALLVRYEDIAAKPELLHRVEEHLEIQVDRELIDRKVGSSEREGKKPRVNRLDSWLLKRTVGSTAEQLGYRL
jgi:hypothetical protein